MGGQLSTTLSAPLLFVAELLSKLRCAASKVSKNNCFVQQASVAAGAQVAEQTCPCAALAVTLQSFAALADNRSRQSVKCTALSYCALGRYCVNSRSAQHRDGKGANVAHGTEANVAILAHSYFATRWRESASLVTHARCRAGYLSCSVAPTDRRCMHLQTRIRQLCLMIVSLTVYAVPVAQLRVETRCCSKATRATWPGETSTSRKTSCESCKTLQWCV